MRRTTARCTCRSIHSFIANTMRRVLIAILVAMLGVLMSTLAWPGTSSATAVFIPAGDVATRALFASLEMPLYYLALLIAFRMIHAPRHHEPKRCIQLLWYRRAMQCAHRVLGAVCLCFGCILMVARGGVSSDDGLENMYTQRSKMFCVFFPCCVVAFQTYIVHQLLYGCADPSGSHTTLPEYDGQQISLGETLMKS